MGSAGLRSNIHLNVCYSFTQNYWTDLNDICHTQSWFITRLNIIPRDWNLPRWTTVHVENKSCLPITFQSLFYKLMRHILCNWLWVQCLTELKYQTQYHYIIKSQNYLPMLYTLSHSNNSRSWQFWTPSRCAELSLRRTWCNALPSWALPGGELSIVHRPRAHAYGDRQFAAVSPSSCQ